MGPSVSGNMLGGGEKVRDHVQEGTDSAVLACWGGRGRGSGSGDSGSGSHRGRCPYEVASSPPALSLVDVQSCATSHPTERAAAEDQVPLPEVSRDCPLQPAKPLEQSR